jgi:predicted AlkP superfamily phosphohydrolase/phosphomutase
MNRLLVIGLDGATLDLIRPWATQGRLPLFARLMAEGAHGVLRSVPNTDTAPAWSSFATGLGPGRHGLFNELGWAADRRTLRPVRGGDRQGQSFWAQASAAGRKVIAINVPFSYPAEPVHGVTVAGIDAPGPHAPGFCHPPEFLAAFEQVHGPYRIDSQISQFVKQDQPGAGLAAAYATARQHVAATRVAMTQIDWQLCVLVFSIPDEMQHFFWQQMRSGSGPHQDAILAGHRFLEEQIAALLAAAGLDTNLLIVSDHGFGPICATPAFLSDFLRTQGFLRDLPPARRSPAQQLSGAAYGWLRRRLGEGMKERLRRALPGLRNRVESDARFAGIDWSATQAYVAASPWEIFVNLRGREPQGIVEPGAAYDELLDRLCTALRAWRDPSGRPRLRAVYRREEVYAGPFLAAAPDLTLEYDPAAAPPAGSLPGNTSRFDADHQPDGLLIAAGPAIAPGQVVEGAQLIDVAPTVLALLGLEPGDVDGRVVLEGVSRREQA